MNEIVSVMLYLILATGAYACFYIAESFKQAIIPFVVFGILLCFRFLWYQFFSSVFLFQYLPSWFYPGALIAYAVGGALGLIYLRRERSRIKAIDATYERESK